MFGDTSYQDGAEALDAVAEQLLWEAGVAEPPVDAFFVALRLGLTVTENSAIANRAQFVRVGGSQAEVPQPTIVLGDDQRFERRQFAVAHELGEFAAVRVYDRLGIEPRQTPLSSREQVANALAGRLLLPRRWFHKQGLVCDWDLTELKETFWTASHEMIARRMIDMTPRVVITICDQGEVAWRRSNSGQSTTKLLDAEYECWREVHQWGTPSFRNVPIADAGEVVVRCWPVHEPDWRREILRTEVTLWE